MEGLAAVSPPSPALLSTVSQCDRCPFWGCGGSWLCHQVFPAISAVSILELAANSCQAPGCLRDPTSTYSDAVVNQRLQQPNQ